MNLPVDIGTLKTRAKIYSLKDPNEKLYHYHKAINEAAYQIALENPMVVENKTELIKLAVAKLDIDGYSYCKKKSRSKQLNAEVNTPKRAKMQSDFRAKRVREVSEDLTEVDKQVELCTKQRDRYSNSQEYSSAIAISEKIEGLKQRKRKLQTELTMLQRKEAKSQNYHNAKRKLRGSSETCSATVKSSENNFMARGNGNTISVFFTAAQESKTKEAEPMTVEDSDDSFSTGNIETEEQEEMVKDAEATTGKTAKSSDNPDSEMNFVNDETTAQDENTKEETATLSKVKDRDYLISTGNVKNGKTTVQDDAIEENSKKVVEDDTIDAGATAIPTVEDNSQLYFLCQPML